MEKLLSIGKVLNFHGIRGEVKVGFSQGNEKVFSEVKEFYAVKDSKTIKLNVERMKFHKKVALIKFKQINSVDEAIEIKGSLLKLPKDELDKYLEEDEFYVSDLVGVKVYDSEENYLGVITGVANVKEHHTLFIKDPEGREQMIPFNKEFVPVVDLDERRITINMIEGLFKE